MAAGLVVPVSGPYVGTWAGYLIGTNNDDGWALIGSYQGQEINATDAYGMTLGVADFAALSVFVDSSVLDVLSDFDL